MRLMQAHSVGLEVPHFDFETNKAAMEERVKQFQHIHTTLYGTSTAFTGEYGRIVNVSIALLLASQNP